MTLTEGFCSGINGAAQSQSWLGYLGKILLIRTIWGRPFYTPDFHQVVGFVAGMQEKPDFLHKVVDAGFLPGAPDVHHPLMGRLVVFLALIGGDVPEREQTGAGKIEI